MIYKKSTESPIFEWNMLTLAFVAEVLFLTFWLITALTYENRKLSTLMFQIGWIFVGFAFLFWAFALVLPTFQFSYRSVFSIPVIVAVDFGLGITNFFTAKLPHRRQLYQG